MYDPSVLKEFAARMYSRAAVVVLTWTFIGILIGLVGGLVLGAPIVAALDNAKRVDKDAALIVVLVVGAIGGGLGFAIGSEKAFWMRLEAQKVLCMLQTEVNTRKPRTLKPPTPTEQPPATEGPDEPVV